jgi:hypothetical protein
MASKSSRGVGRRPSAESSGPTSTWESSALPCWGAWKTLRLVPCRAVLRTLAVVLGGLAAVDALDAWVVLVVLARGRA